MPCSVKPILTSRIAGAGRTPRFAHPLAHSNAQSVVIANTTCVKGLCLLVATHVVAVARIVVQREKQCKNNSTQKCFFHPRGHFVHFFLDIERETFYIWDHDAVIHLAAKIDVRENGSMKNATKKAAKKAPAKKAAKKKK
jgi:hypothetical protein